MQLLGAVSNGRRRGRLADTAGPFLHARASVPAVFTQALPHGAGIGLACARCRTMPCPDSLMSQPRPFASPRHVTDRSHCHFYHSMDLPGGAVDGAWDLRGRLPEYIGGVDLKDRSVLDVGTASGFLTFEMEKLGARVVSFDAASADDIAFVPMHDHGYVTDHAAWSRETNAFLDRLKNGYWFAHRELASRSRALYGNVYELDTYGHSFDVAVVGQILVHLKDPVNALAAVARTCRETLIITEGTIDSPYPDARLCAHSISGGLGYMWWLCSVAFYRDVLTMQNFEIASVTANHFRHNSDDWPLTTIVAHRRQ